MELTVITTLYDFAKGIFDLNGKLKEAKNKQKEKIAEFLNKIAGTLENLIQNINSNNSLAQNCGELSAYMENLMELLKPYLPSEKINEFSSSLGEASLIRGLQVELSSDTQKQKIDQINESIGKFKALANIITL